MPTHFLFMVMLGCKPKGRVTEQHDIFFGIAPTLFDLKQDLIDFWPEAKRKIHVDVWQKVTNVDGYSIEIVAKTEALQQSEKLFFINLGGYKENEFEEYHYKVLAVAKNKATAIKKSKKTSFFKHCTLEGSGASHIDDKYGIDVDDIYAIKDILLPKHKDNFQIQITKTDFSEEDEKHIGYLQLAKIQA